MSIVVKPYTVSIETRPNINYLGENVLLSGLMLSDEAREVLEIIFNVALNAVISVLGSAVNVVNIVIFIKQGFRDSVNISLCALAVSDLGSLLPLLWLSLCSNPLLHQSCVDCQSVEMEYITGGLPHSCFVRTTSLITAFITFERCVCVALPLKAKNIITPTRTLISILIMFVIMIATYLTIYSPFDVPPSLSAKLNKTALGLMYTAYIGALEYVALSFIVSVQLSSFIIVSICTVILICKLLSKSKWRHKAIVVSDVSESMSTRDKKVMKMVTFISGVFIICYIPGVINLVMVVHFSPDYSATGEYENSYLVSWAAISVIEGINSSVTIFVYYNMSSKFRITFNELFSTTNKVSMDFKTIVKTNSVSIETTLLKC